MLCSLRADGLLSKAGGFQSHFLFQGDAFFYTFHVSLTNGLSHTLNKYHD